MRPYLIQRLEKPRETINPFSFGGGFVNGGLNKDVMKMIKPIFSFDYMGAAEFEFGAIPEAFNEMLQKEYANEMTVGSLALSCKLSKRSIEFWEYMDKKKVKTDKGKVTFYYYCPQNIELDVKDVIKAMSKGDKGLFLKEQTQLERSVKTFLNGEETDIIGWLDIENYFFIFIEEVPRNKIVELFKTYVEQHKNLEKIEKESFDQL